LVIASHPRLITYNWKLLSALYQDERSPFSAALVHRTVAGGYKVIDANGQSLAYFYARENDHDANTAGVLTMDEARRLASNFAKLPQLLSQG
jgi:hypothetical protein